MVAKEELDRDFTIAYFAQQTVTDNLSCSSLGYEESTRTVNGLNAGVISQVGGRSSSSQCGPEKDCF